MNPLGITILLVFGAFSFLSFAIFYLAQTVAITESLYSKNGHVVALSGSTVFVRSLISGFLFACSSVLFWLAGIGFIQ